MLLSELFKQDLEIRPKAVLVIGAPKSGKTRWLYEFFEKNRGVGYEDLNISQFNTLEDRSKRLEECIFKGINFAYEGISLKESRIVEFIEKLKVNNYKITVVYLNRELDKLLENKEVEASTIKKAYGRIQEILPFLKEKADRFIEA